MPCSPEDLTLAERLRGWLDGLESCRRRLPDRTASNAEATGNGADRFRSFTVWEIAVRVPEARDRALGYGEGLR